MTLRELIKKYGYGITVKGGKWRPFIVKAALDDHDFYVVQYVGDRKAVVLEDYPKGDYELVENNEGEASKKVGPEARDVAPGDDK